MIVQWCVKGLQLDDDATARQLIDDGIGLISNGWRNSKDATVSPTWVRNSLSHRGIDLHVNHFGSVDPATGRPVSCDTPFISLSAGTVSRDTAAQTNRVRRARHTALWFGSGFGRVDHAYLFVCWVVVAPRPAIGIEGVAEEVRDLTVYRRYSAYQTEGEITAKVIVPDNQIRQCERWDLQFAATSTSTPTLSRTWVYPNPRFTPPEQLSNVRELI
jgi:hypothetical protein